MKEISEILYTSGEVFWLESGWRYLYSRAAESTSSRKPVKTEGTKKGRGCYFAPAPARLFTPLYGAKADALVDEAPNLPPGDEAVAVILIEEIDQL
jgi:hypothetical protein